MAEGVEEDGRSLDAVGAALKEAVEDEDEVRIMTGDIFPTSADEGDDEVSMKFVGEDDDDEASGGGRRLRKVHGGEGTKKRKSYTNSFKLEAVELAEKIGNRPAAKKLGMEESNIRDWRKRKTELEMMPANKMTKRHARPRWLNLETTLAEWFLDRQSRKLYVTTNMVKEKGMEIAAKLGHVDFSGSSGWVARFMSRLRESGGNPQMLYTSPSKSANNEDLQNKAECTKESDECDESYHQLPSPISHCETHCETLSDPQPVVPSELTDKALSFRTRFTEKRAQNELKRRNAIIVLDEVPMSLDMPVEHHVAFSANELNSNMEMTHIIPAPEKFQFTVVLSASAAGGKLPPLVIFKGQPLPEEVTSSLSEGILPRANKAGWIDPNLIDDWIENSWKKWLWPQRSEENLLILDSCETHLSSEIKFRCSKYFQLYFVPEGMGEYLNPLEISVIKSFKQNLIKQWEQELLDRAYGASNDEDGDQRLSRQMRNYVMICRWVLGAWKDINPQVIMNGFAKAGIESFSPEDVVEAILNDNTGHVGTDDGDLVHSNNNAIQIEEDYVGDKFNGWS